MLGYILAGAAFVAAGLFVRAVPAAGPFRVQRSTRIDAPADTVHGYINDLGRWSAWSPWEKMDPAMHRTFSGPAAGPGAQYAWKGNRKVGEGRMQILRSTPDQVEVQLEFIKPFASVSTSTFTLTPAAGGTEVTWTMDGPSPLMMRVMRVFMDMDRMIGRDFEAGLAALRQATESRPR
jgi:hypothetical protein